MFVSATPVLQLSRLSVRSFVCVLSLVAVTAKLAGAADEPPPFPPSRDAARSGPESGGQRTPASRAAAAEPQANTRIFVPSEVTLTNGATLHRVTVVRWQKEAVVLRHAGGVDPVRYANITPEQRAIFEAYREKGLAQEAAKEAIVRKTAEAQRAAELAELDHKEKIRAAIANKELLTGMTADETIDAVGKPQSVSQMGDGNVAREQWTYDRYYLYFEKGILVAAKKRESSAEGNRRGR